MDKRKTVVFPQCEKVSLAYFHEQSILRKRLDKFQREQDKSLKKISNRQETLANAFVAQNGKSQNIQASVMEHLPKQRSQPETFSNLGSGNPEGMEIHAARRLRKVSAPSASYRKLSFASEPKSGKKTVRQTSDPLKFSGQTTEQHQAVTFPRRKFTTGHIDLAASSNDFRPSSGNSNSHIFKSNIFRNQNEPNASFLRAKLPSRQLDGYFNTPLSNSKSETEYSMEKINLPTRLSLCVNTPSRMVNETRPEDKNKYLIDSLVNVSEKVLDNRRKTSNGNLAGLQGLPNVSDNKIKPQERKEKKIISKIAPGTLVTKGQFKNSGQNANDVSFSREFSTPQPQAQDLSRGSSEFNLDGESEVEKSSESSKSVQRKRSFSRDQRKMDLHALTIASTRAGARGGIHHLGNAWSDNSTTPRRKISTVQAPQGIVSNENSTVSPHEKSEKEQISAESEARRKVEALRSFRRLALVAVAAERFRNAAPKTSSENRKISVSPERKTLTKARLEELQRPTESYLRQVAADEKSSNSLSLRTRSKSVSGSSTGKTSAHGFTNFRRVSQAAMATRILIDRGSRKVSGTGLSELESRKETNQGKTLAEMMNELKNCRYLRNSNFDDE